ncbi:MAG: insulinase family protein, partial [Chitinophagaceae bacterium]
MNSPNRTIAPKIHDAIDFEFTLPPIDAGKLDNGIPFYWLSGGVQDVVEVDWVFPAGLWQEPKAAVALACGGLLKNGTSQKTAHQIHEAIEFFGANLQVSTGDDYTVISLFSLTKDLPLLLPIVQEILNDAQFPEEELALYKQNAVQRLMVSLRQCDFVANQRIDALLYGEEHPYGRYSKVEKIEALNRGDLTEFFKENFDLGKAKIFMAGKVGNTEIDLVNKFFGAAKVELSTNGNSKIIQPGIAPIGQKFHETNDANGVQAAIRIAREFPNHHHPDFPKMVILNTLFGGYFGSRLMSNIREEKGYTYGIHSTL